MTKLMRFSIWSVSLAAFGRLEPPLPSLKATQRGGHGPITMVCDAGRTFTVAYANNFDTAFVETEGERLELPRLPTALSMTPTQPEFGHSPERGRSA